MDEPGSAGLLAPVGSVSTWEWVLPMLVAVVVHRRRSGSVVQQLFLRWNQGQDLRQALITIAVSVIIADQVIAHFPRMSAGAVQFGGERRQHRLAGLDGPVRRPAGLRRRVLAARARHARARRSSSAIALWLWLYRTKTGMVIRAGVDDRQMTSALGHQHPGRLRDRVRRRLRAGGVRRGRRRVAGQRRPAAGRAVAAVLARRRDRRRHGLALRRGRRLAALRARVHVLGFVPADRRATSAARSTRSSSRSC